MIHQSIWNNLCQQPTLAATYGNYGKLVSDSTTKLQQCVQGILTMLHDRAIGLTRCANFDAALRDATAIQELAPTSALGYLCAADIYSQQGRQQAVIRICNKALDVVHHEDPDYAKLQRVKMDAKQRDAIRLDIISKLPLDIAVHVLFPMVIGDEELLDSFKVCPYLNVSKAWRDCVVQACPGGLCFKLDNENSPSCVQVTQFARYTSSLHLGSYRHGQWLSDLLLSGNMHTLKEIKIENVGPDINVDHLVSSLRSVSKTLTHLTIEEYFPDELDDFPRRNAPIRVTRILTYCPNLEFLHIHHNYYVTFSTVPITKTWPKLTDLRLYAGMNGIFNDLFLEMLKRFPSLAKLALDPCFGIQPSTMIHHYCPSLQDLDMITDDSIPIHLRPPEPEQRHHDQRITGALEKLSVLDRSGDIDPPKEVCEILKQHHHTLVDLQLGFDYADSSDEDFFNLEYPCLETLKLACSIEASICFGWWIVEKAPLLEELRITAFAIATTPMLLEIQPPPSLKKLVLNLFAEDQLEEPVHADVFLDQFAQHGELKELNMTLNNNVDNTATLGAICRLPKLEHLELSFEPDWSTNAMDSFLDMLLQGRPQLKSLEMECTTSPSLYSIRVIKKFVHLEHIGFAVNDTTEYCILLSTLMTLPNLKSVRIYQDTTLAHEFGYHLAYFRSDIKFAIGKTQVGTLNF